MQRALRIGAVLYGGNFTVHRDALEAIGGFDTAIEFHGEDTNVGRRLAEVGLVRLSPRWFIYTSARRYKAMGRVRVLRAPAMWPPLASTLRDTTTGSSVRYRPRR